MKIADALRNVTHLFLDTAPVIYYVENNPTYAPRVVPVFTLIDNGSVAAVVSPVTLAECLVVPIRLGLASLEQDFLDLLLHGGNTTFAPIDDNCAREAAQMRVRYNLNLLDALQVAVALNTGCQALLTNDAALRRIGELNILVVDDLEP